MVETGESQIPDTYFLRRDHGGKKGGRIQASARYRLISANKKIRKQCGRYPATTEWFIVYAPSKVDYAD